MRSQPPLPPASRALRGGPVIARYPSDTIAEVLLNVMQEWELPLLEHSADRIMLVNLFHDAFQALWQQHKHASRTASLSSFVTAELRWCAYQANALYVSSYADTIMFPSIPAHRGRRSSTRVAASALLAGAAQ